MLETIMKHELFLKFYAFQVWGVISYDMIVSGLFDKYGLGFVQLAEVVDLYYYNLSHQTSLTELPEDYKLKAFIEKMRNS